MAEMDPHSVLGVRRGAPPEEIRKAYIGLIKKYHPDVNPGGGEHVKVINIAYGLLSGGNRLSPRRPVPWPTESRNGCGETSGFRDIFGVARKHASSRTYVLSIDFFDAIFGTTRRLWAGPRESFDVVIPAGAHDRQVFDLPGAVRVELNVAPHAFFRRIGQDIWVVTPVSPAEAAEGARITVPTITGRVALTIPKGTGSGTVLRISGRGVAAAGGVRGDQYVRILVVRDRDQAAH